MPTWSAAFLGAGLSTSVQSSSALGPPARTGSREYPGCGAAAAVWSGHTLVVVVGGGYSCPLGAIRDNQYSRKKQILLDISSWHLVLHAAEVLLGTNAHGVPAKRDDSELFLN